MIKIIHVITDSNIGGAGRVLINFLSAYDRKRFDLTVVLPKGSLLIPEIKALNVDYHEEDIGERSMSVGAVSMFVKLFRRLKPQIVHTHASLAARIGARICGGIKIVHTRHSVFDVPTSQKQFPRKQIQGIINNRLSDRIIAVSPAAKDNLLELGTNPDKIEIVFNGVKPPKKLTEQELEQYRDSLDIPSDSFVCAIIARLDAVKGHRFLLEAAKLLADYPDIWIVVAGTGPESENLLEMAEKLGLKNVKFLGFVTDVYKLENLMDVQLNASYGTEATSLSLLEGLCLQKPAIVSDFGGNPFVIDHGKTGLVIPKQNPTALKDAILSLYNDRERVKIMGQAAGVEFNKRFTVLEMTKQTEAIYLRLLGVENC